MKSNSRQYLNQKFSINTVRHREDLVNNTNKQIKNELRTINEAKTNYLCTAKSKDSVSRNLIECFKEVQNKESRDKLSDINHCNDYETENFEDEKVEKISGKAYYDKIERNTNLLSPGQIYIDNDPVNTSDCTSFPHYVVSPTPEKDNSIKNSREEDYEERFYKHDQLADIKNQ